MSASARPAQRISVVWLAVLWVACVSQSLLVASREPLLAVALPAGVILGGVLWISVGYAPALIVASAFLIPLEVESGSTTRLNIVFLLAAAAVTVLLIRTCLEGRLSSLIDRVTLPLFGLALVAVLSFTAGLLRNWGPSEIYSSPLRAQVAGLALFLLSAGSALLSLSPASGERHRKVLILVFLVLGGVFLLRFLLPGAGPVLGSFVHEETIKGVFRTWLVAIALGQCLWNRELGGQWRLACGGIVVVCLWSSLTLNLAWATGWLPPMVAVLALLWITSPKWGSLLLLMGLLGLGVFWQSFLDIIMVGDQSYSLMTRWEALKILSGLIADYPLLGMGMANYYHTVASHPILGWFVPFSSHNNFADVAAQTGLIGVFFLLWFSFELLRMIWRVGPGLTGGFRKALLLSCWGGWIGSLVAAILADWLIPFVYNIGVGGFRASVLSWIFAGTAIATARTVGGAASVERKTEQGDLAGTQRKA